MENAARYDLCLSVVWFRVLCSHTCMRQRQYINNRFDKIYSFFDISPSLLEPAIHVRDFSAVFGQSTDYAHKKAYQCNRHETIRTYQNRKFIRSMIKTTNKQTSPQQQ